MYKTLLFSCSMEVHFFYLLIKYSFCLMSKHNCLNIVKRKYLESKPNTYCISGLHPSLTRCKFLLSSLTFSSFFANSVAFCLLTALAIRSLRPSTIIPPPCNTLYIFVKKFQQNWYYIKVTFK